MYVVTHRLDLVALVAEHPVFGFPEGGFASSGARPLLLLR
jgi:hypothetical protein